MANLGQGESIKKLIPAILLFFCFELQAYQVAFYLDYYGNPIHLALGLEEGEGHRWLHASVEKGVLEEDLENIRYGLSRQLYQCPNGDDLKLLERTQAYLGRPYDPIFLWDEESIYCSELIGKIFDLPTRPMNFERPDPKYWVNYYQRLGVDMPVGLPGISPEALLQHFQKICIKLH